VSRDLRKIVAEVDMNPLKNFMEPESIAILGASKRPGSISALVIGNLLKLGYEGRIHLVNPKGGELSGLKMHSDISEIDGSVDLAVIYLPPTAVVDAIKACSRKGVSSAIVVSDGMDEAMEEGTTLTARMLEVARGGGVRIIGPNSMGVVNAQNKLTTSFASFDRLLEGGLSLIAQTGLFTGAALEWIVSVQGLNISKSIDLANKCDIDELDCLEYLREDSSTRVIGMHIEEVSDGKRFIDVARRTTLVKPILAIKPGKTEIGARAIASHTGSLAGRDEFYGAAFSQSGIIRVYDMEDLADLAKAFLHLPLLKGGNLGVVTFSGGWGALAADLCEEFGLSIAVVPERSLQKIQEISPPWRKITNPVDIWPPSKLDTSETYRRAIRTLVDCKSVDAVFVIAPAMDGPIFDVASVIREEVTRNSEKPIVTLAVGNRAGVEKAFSMIDDHCIFFPTVRRAIRALSALYNYHRYIKSSP
jgi:acyl-CoA synthetase (NDP forming)